MLFVDGGDARRFRSPEDARDGFIWKSDVGSAQANKGILCNENTG